MDKQTLVMIIMLAFIVSATFSEVFKYYLRTKRVSHGDIKNSEIDLLQQQNRQLQERVAVLEKIVTEPSYDLKQRINAL
ncbi:MULTISPECIES: hypothetical protein [Shewanella]|uniref:hypothetical protein n=1 Tax=Shewanella TaxID=22 RepID=UPI00048D5C83|nr:MULTISPECIES: hypothetical protein [Shewanella]QLE83696.1 hypothetical protein FLM48_00480 [Shewanella sp. Scap07]